MNAKKIQVSDAAMTAARKVVAAHGLDHEVDCKRRLEALNDAHAEILSAMVLAYGGRIAAERCRKAAQAIESIPTMTEVIASAMQQVLDTERGG